MELHDLEEEVEVQPDQVVGAEGAALKVVQAQLHSLLQQPGHLLLITAPPVQQDCSQKRHILTNTNTNTHLCVNITSIEYYHEY